MNSSGVFSRSQKLSVTFPTAVISCLFNSCQYCVLYRPLDSDWTDAHKVINRKTLLINSKSESHPVLLCKV